MTKIIGSIAVATMAATAVAVPYTGPWLRTWDFNDGLQGWSIVEGSGYWVDPAVAPDGPVLPDGSVSNAGAGNIYAPDGTRVQISIPPVRSFIIQCDAWLPNLMPLNINPYLPGNGLQNAGIGAISASEGKYRYVAGRNPDGVKMRDYSWDSAEHTRSWLFEEEGVAKADMWDRWVTLQFVHNWNDSGKYTAHVYTPWDSPVHNGPGWYSFGEYDIHPNKASQ